MIRRILVPLDGSAFAEEALRVATELAAATGSSLILLRAVPTPHEIKGQEQYNDYLDAGPGWPPHRRAVVSYLDQELMAQMAIARDYLECLRGALERADSGVNVQIEVRLGAPDVAINSACRDHQVDLVVMATHGRTGLQRLILGSVANEVLKQGTTPLLLIRPGMPERAQNPAARDPITAG